MNTRKLLRYLGDHGCRLYRNGGEHVIWVNAEGDRFMPVPRHAEKSQGVVEKICRYFDIPRPRFK